jgi:SNF2 family DNA or RNA helicase
VDLTAYYNGVDESTPPGRLMAMHMCMEMLLDHPDLIVESGQKYMNDSPEGSEYAYGLWQAGELDEIFDSAKFDMLVDELTIILSDPKSKVLVFSKYKYMLELIQHDLPYKYKKNWGNVIFNGDMSAKAKEAAKKEFTENPDCRIFLSSYAGGYGQDMYMADYLVNYDLPWSFGMQDQINSRHVRVSSEFDKIYIRNMITEWSVEERKQRILTRKRQISRLAIDGQASNSNAVPMDDDFLKDHLDFVLTSPAWHGKISKWGEN